MRVRRAAFVATLVAVALTTGCAGEAETESPEGAVSITTGSTRGVYYAWANALAGELRNDHPGLAVRVVPSSGSVQNLQRLASGENHLALATEDATEGAAADAAAAEGAAQKPSPSSGNRGNNALVALARVYDDYAHVIVREDSGIRGLADLRGRPVAIGAMGSGVALMARRVLLEAHLQVRELPLDLVSGASSLDAGTVDAVFWSGGLPTAAVTDLAARRPLRLLALDEVAGGLRTRYGVAYRAATIPAGSYGQSEPVPTIASPNLLVGRADLDPRVIEAVLSTLFERRAAIAAAVPAANALDRRTAILTGSMPLHPAAVRYYRRTKS